MMMDLGFEHRMMLAHLRTALDCVRAVEVPFSETMARARMLATLERWIANTEAAMEATA